LKTVRKTVRKAYGSFRFWQKDARNGVRVFFAWGPEADYFVSEKQNRALEKARSHEFFFVVTEGERFVWASNDLEWLSKTFEAEFVEFDPHLDAIRNPEAVELDDLKN
jgi:hypothetical protein